MTRLGLIVVALGMFCGPVHAANPLACYEAPGTLENTCVDTTKVRVNGNVRAAPVYSGGPKTVGPTSYKFVVDCVRMVATLQDRNGANFGGGLSSATPVSQTLSGIVCNVAKPKQDNSLRQF